MKDCNCGYCMGGDILAGFGIKICDLKVSQLILFKEQSHKGRVIVAHKKHVSEITDLTAEERAEFIEEINKVSVAIEGYEKAHKIYMSPKVEFFLKAFHVNMQRTMTT